MAARLIMLQGTGSNVGKSLLVAGLVRHFARKNIRVAPFKPQNMSNNAAVAADGGEIGRAQALQAIAAGLEPSFLMNPVLLKPQGNHTSQIILNGRYFATAKAADYGAYQPQLLAGALDSLAKLREQHDLIIIEGAGSPAEINLRARDLANMGFVSALDVPCPVFLVGDIDRGGVIANLVGTYHVLPPNDRAFIKGFMINRFRGDPSLFTDGMTYINKQTGWSPLGIVPWFEAASQLPSEDSQDFEAKYPRSNQLSTNQPIHIVVPKLTFMANFDDLDPLAQHPAVRLSILNQGEALPADCDLVLLMGSKNTRKEAELLHKTGWAIDIKAHARRGGAVIGLCGGYQLLGSWIHDPEGIEGTAGSSEGLGLLEIETILKAPKITKTVKALFVKGQIPVNGYEIHMGRTEGADCNRPILLPSTQESDHKLTDCGAQSADGRIIGCYLHGLFANQAFCNQFLQQFKTQPIDTDISYHQRIDDTLNLLADHLATYLDLSYFEEK